MFLHCIFLLVPVVISEAGYVNKLQAWLDEYDCLITEKDYQTTLKDWAFSTNVTEFNKAAKTEANIEYSKLRQEKAAEAKKKFGDQWYLASDPKLLRLLKSLLDVGVDLNDEDQAKLSQLNSDLNSLFAQTTICPFENGQQNCSATDHWLFDPTVKRLAVQSTDYDVLEYIWKEWFDKASKAMREPYIEMIQLNNKGAKAAGYEDYGAVWRSAYEQPNFDKQAEALWFEMLPLFEQLHTYVRKNMQKRYPSCFNTSAIPSHILGHIWGRFWMDGNVQFLPYPDVPSVDITETLKERKTTVRDMFEMGNDFFVSMGMKSVPASFWNLSMLERPDDRVVTCHPTAWDFTKHDDVRIRMCTEVNQEDFVTIHHELGHTQYQMQYAHQHKLFRNDPNPGFHEAIGDTISLSVTTPKHLRRIGLLDSDTSQDAKQTINYLYTTALKKLPSLTFGLLNDLWRYQVYGGLDVSEWNKEWNDLRFQYQGLVPPVPRDHNVHLDPVTIYHIIINIDFLRYYLATIFQFQFYETLCKVSGHEGPAHNCDFYNSTEAGAALADLLAKGASEPWQEVLQDFAGTKQPSMKALLNYFQPLAEYFEEENKGECFGWGYEWPADIEATLPKPRCPKVFAEAAANEEKANN